MTPAHQRSHAASDFARLVAVYLCLVLALQGFAAARALGAGPLHHHAGSAVSDSVEALVLSHHGHQHQSSERHHHSIADISVQHAAAPDEATLDAAAFALTAALALMAVGAGRQPSVESRSHVWRAASTWFGRSVPARLPFRPPRPR